MGPHHSKVVIIFSQQLVSAPKNNGEIVQPVSRNLFPINEAINELLRPADVVVWYFGKSEQTE